VSDPSTPDPSDGGETTPDELEQLRPVAPDADDPTIDDPGPDEPLGDQKSEADEADLVEQHQAMPGDEEEERR
jgi:hypothetical protein